MPRPKEMHVRMVINMPADLAAQVKKFRHAQEIDTQAEAIRALIEMGLEAAAKRQKGRPS